MSAVEIFLWPVVGFLAVAALAGLWQARNPAAQPADRPGPVAGTARRRSLILGGLALAILAFLLTRS